MVSLQFEFKTLSKPGKDFSSVNSEQIKEITFNHVDSDLYILIYILTYIYFYILIYSDSNISIYSYIF